MSVSVKEDTYLLETKDDKTTKESFKSWFGDENKKSIKNKETSKGSNLDEEKDDDEDEKDVVSMICPCTKDSFMIRAGAFWMIATLELFDMIADWLLFSDVLHTKDGLVYGAYRTEIVYSLLAFSVLGTLFNMVELPNYFMEYYFQKPFVDPNFISALTIWFEDVPQVVINVVIVICRDEAASIFQLVKALVLIALETISIIAFSVCLVIKTIKRKEEEEEKKKEPKKRKKKKLFFSIAVILGEAVVVLGAIYILIMSYFEHNEKGEIQFNMPKSLFEGRYDRERYFKNVSIFVHDPSFEITGMNRYSTVQPTRYLSWIKLMEITDIMERGTGTFKIDFDTTRYEKFVIWESTGSDKLEINECFAITDKDKMEMSYQSNCQSLITGNKGSIIIKFLYTPRSIPTLIFGDIRYNIKVAQNGVCKSLNKTLHSELNDHDARDHMLIRYFRTRKSDEDGRHLVITGNNTARYFRDSVDLVDIEEVWKTGFHRCKSTGSLAPHFDSKIEIDCFNML